MTDNVAHAGGQKIAWPEIRQPLQLSDAEGPPTLKNEARNQVTENVANEFSVCSNPGMRFAHVEVSGAFDGGRDRHDARGLFPGNPSESCSG